MAGLAWSPDEEAYLRALMAQFRPDVAAVLRAFAERYPERPDAAVRSKYRRLCLELGPVDESVAVQEWTAKRDAAVREVAQQQPVFQIVELPPIAPVPVTYQPNPCYIVSSDHHWPLHDPRVETIILRAIETLKPRAYILNGDGPDMLALSKYPKDMRAGKHWELRDEQHAAQSWWWHVATLMQPWGGLLYETEANHSGNGHASRWGRWLSENCAPLFGLEGFEERMTYPSFFHPPDAHVQMVEEVVIANDLRVRHGEMVRKHGGYSARAHGDKWQSSVMHGHTHRIGSSIKRRPGIPGVRPDEFIRTYETGCACRLDADYCPGADWAHGLGVIHVDDATNSYGVELIQIINGRATSTALGGTLAA